MIDATSVRCTSVTKESRMRRPFANRKYEKRVITECTL